MNKLIALPNIPTIAVLLSLAACNTADPRGEAVAGEKTATVRGALIRDDAASSSPSTMQAVAVWTYWDEADCDVADDGSKVCSGSYLATSASLIESDGSFSIDVVEAPPAFVHGYDVAIAEAFIAVVPDDADLDVIDFTDPTQTVGVATDYVLVYAPASFEEGTVEAAIVGGPLGQGFHLVEQIEGGEQFDVVLDNGDEVSSHQTGERVGFDQEIEVEPGETQIPTLSL